MPLFAKTTSTNWASVIPWYKATSTSWLKASRVHVKTGVSTWTEVWPRQPGSATSLVASPIYRNDRIEIDFSWTAASGSGTTTTPVATSTYNVAVYINGSVVYSTSLAGTSFTLTNSGSGYQSYAGQSLYFQVQAVAATGVLGPLVQSSTGTVPQLPAPPQVTSVSQSLSYGDLSYSFAHVGGNRLTGFQVNVYGPTGNGTYYYGAATSVSGSGHPWTGSNVNGGTYHVDIYPYGPGGYGPVYSFDGAIPGDVVFSSTRMYTNNPGVTVSSLQGVGTLGSNSTAYQLYWNQEGGANNYYGNVGSGSISLGPSTIGLSAAYPNGTRFRWVGVPLNAYGSGRICTSQFVRRLPNPTLIYPNDSQTWFDPVGWGAPNNTVLQGYDSGYNSYYYGYYFYGNAFRDRMNDTFMGFHLNITSAAFHVERASDGAPSAQTPVLYMHTAGSRSEANNGTWAGGAYLPAVGPDNGSFGSTAGPFSFDASWVRFCIDQTNNWKGFGFFANNGPTDAYNIRLYQAGAGGPVYANNAAGLVRCWHDG